MTTPSPSTLPFPAPPANHDDAGTDTGTGVRVDGLILAGGRARRMQGVDKSLIPLAGRPLLLHVSERLRPQVNHMYLSCNHPAPLHHATGLVLLADTLPDHPGPLAGVLAGLEHSAADLLLCVPCDVPFLPTDLAARMLAALQHRQADACTASDGQNLHPGIMLVRRHLRARLADFLQAGHRQVRAWLQQQRLAIADFSDCPAAFHNVNTPQDLQAAERRLQAAQAAGYTSAEPAAGTICP